MTCPAHVYAIPYLPTIDARAFTVTVLTDPAGGVLPATEFDPSFSLAWNNEALLLECSAVVARPDEVDEGEALWAKDCIELFVGRAPGNAQFYQVVIAPGADPRHPQPRVWTYDHSLASQEIIAGVSAIVTPPRYRCAVALPWQNLGITPREGEMIGLQVAFSKVTADGAMFRASWYPLVAVSPSAMHCLRLANMASAAVNVQMLAAQHTGAMSRVLHTGAPAIWRPSDREPGIEMRVLGAHELISDEIVLADGSRSPLAENAGRAEARLVLPTPERGEQLTIRLSSREATLKCPLPEPAPRSQALPPAFGRAAWMREAGWGVFCHYLTAPEMGTDAWNAQVDAVDVLALAEQLAAVGAPYFFLTVGQNSGHYCAPNAAYDSFTGIHPSKCSRRDLTMELAEAVTRRGIRMCVYATNAAPGYDAEAIRGLEWAWGTTGGWPASGGRHTGDRLGNFQQKWNTILREWSLRWGPHIHAWWIDGCYFADAMYRHPEAPNFASFADALRAGNAQSAVAFNPGVLVPVITHTPEEDYTAGEIDFHLPVCPGACIEQAQYHVLTFLGDWWGGMTPRFPTEFVVAYTLDMRARGGVVTWDVPITSEGLIPMPFLEQLAAVRDACAARHACCCDAAAVHAGRTRMP